MKTGNRSTGRWMTLGGALVLGTAMLATSPAQAGLLDRVERHVERRLRAHDRVRDAIHDHVRHTVRRHSDRDRHRDHRSHRSHRDHHRRDRDRHRARDYDRHRSRRHGDRHHRRGHHSRHFVVPRVIRHQHRSTYRGYYASDAWYAPHRHDHTIYSFPVWDGWEYRYTPYAYCEGELFGAPRGYYDDY